MIKFKKILLSLDKIKIFKNSQVSYGYAKGRLFQFGRGCQINL